VKLDSLAHGFRPIPHAELEVINTGWGIQGVQAIKELGMTWALEHFRGHNIGQCIVDCIGQILSKTLMIENTEELIAGKS